MSSSTGELSGVRWLLLRGIGFVYLCAFVSLGVQLAGLIGTDGILPATRYLEAVRAQVGGWGFWYVPTVAWLASGTVALQVLAGCGAVAAVLVVAEIAALPALVACWICYLSLVTVGQDFLSFQWDILLLEAGFLAIFLAPRGITPRAARKASVPRPFVWLFRLLLFRLMFSSGVVKLLSGDPSWRDLSALHYHFETQPLPTPLAWYAHQLPDVLQRVSAAGMFVIELVVPFLYFAPRRSRLVAAALTVLLQLLIAATGNYGFFNLLTIVLCVSLLDDAALRALRPAAIGRRILGPVRPMTEDAADRPLPPLVGRGPAGWARGTVAVLVLVLGVTQLGGLFVGLGGLPPPLPQLYRSLSPLRLVNGYGLFAVMTRTRPEIVIEGSRDGDTWIPYEFRYQPQDPEQRPPWLAPYIPRLDWQMWFAALGGAGQSRWFGRLVGRLLEGSPAVASLLRGDPFRDEPPRYVRATLYRYRFTRAGETGGGRLWWRRERVGTYLRPVSAADFR